MKLEITAQLLIHNIDRVLILGRNSDKFLAAKEEWQRRHINLGKDDKRLTFVQCDLGDIFAVKEAADQVRSITQRLDILICNGGLGVTTNYERSPQGVEMVFAANCVGHQELVTLLLPLLKRTANQHSESREARIVVTSSSLHSVCRTLDFNQLTTPARVMPMHPYIDGFWRYCRSKLGNILFTRELARRIEQGGPNNIYVNVFFPGNIVTEQWKAWDDTQDGAATAVYLATSDRIRVDGIRGQYYIPIAKPDATTDIGNDPVLARDLWNWIDTKVTEHLGLHWQQET
ncbi:hypothetical protein AtubIFM55763_004027 [Aspergillus tubingensis]|uniref:Short-chain dehydrogenase n=1 Tax=Aspergillus tubingensis TaxID=5068 RepID=A0A9W6ATP3_ASPTU|nr:hypothetical protein AtubIFM55763_004027 [Aspergillus tubingensis]GLA85385.1 hypothetical protein AtubIFM56815_009621 [Aspergillus tubingensis]GLB20218.1 hypothetical protein AtubIFM61612_010145 [Aspergillus tubingensis]